MGVKMQKMALLSYHIGLECVTLITNASVVCPDRVRPLLSTIVPETCSSQHKCGTVISQ